MAEQRTKIEEIKKKTNYYSTKNLLERYGDSPARNVSWRVCRNSPTDRRVRQTNGPSTPNGNALRQRQVTGAGNTPKSSATGPQGAQSGARSSLGVPGTPANQRSLPSQQLLQRMSRERPGPAGVYLTTFFSFPPADGTTAATLVRQGCGRSPWR